MKICNAETRLTRLGAKLAELDEVMSWEVIEQEGAPKLNCELQLTDGTYVGLLEAVEKSKSGVPTIKIFLDSEFVEEFAELVESTVVDVQGFVTYKRSRDSVLSCLRKWEKELGI